MSLLGLTVRDRISEFEGIVIGEAVYLYSAAQVLVVPTGMNDGAPRPPIWFDVDRVEARREVKAGFTMHKGEL